MELIIEIDENEIIEKAKQLIVEDIASRMLDEFRRTPEKHCYRNVIKTSIVRTVIIVIVLIIMKVINTIARNTERVVLDANLHGLNVSMTHIRLMMESGR